MRHGKPGCVPFVAADAIAHRIDMGGHPGFAHPRQHQRVGLALLRRQEHAREAALHFRQAAEGIAVVPHALRVERVEKGGTRVGHGQASEPRFYRGAVARKCETHFHIRAAMLESAHAMSARTRTPVPGKRSAPAARGRSSAARVPLDKGAGHTQALSRGLAVLEALAATDGGATLTSLAAQLDLPAPTAHRLLATLEAGGFVRAGPKGEWQVGVRAFRVGSAFLAHRNLVVQAYPHLRELMDRAGETANLAVIESGEAVFVEQVQCRELMRMSAKLGSRAPLHASGVGKAMLAALPERAVAATIGRRDLTVYTPRTLTTFAALASELVATRARGYAVDDEEHAAGLRCVAAAVLDENGQPWAAVSLAGPTTRMTHERLPALGALVRATASDLTSVLGGSAAA